MNYKDEIMSFVAKNPGTTSYNIWEYLDTVKAGSWANAGGIRGWLVKRRSVLTTANLGKIILALDDLEEEGKLESHGPTTNRGPTTGNRNSYYIKGNKS